MNRQPALDSWASGQLFGISEQFARGGIELSGISGWFALAPTAQIVPSGHRPRHATGHLSHATGPADGIPRQLANATDELSRPPGQLETSPGGLENAPGRLSRSPGEPENAPTHPARLPSEPEGSGAARRDSVAARRAGLEAPRRGMAARRGGEFFVPEGRRGLVTGGASRSDAEPVEGIAPARVCPGGAEGSNDRLMRQNSSAPAGAGITQHTLSTGYVGEAPTPPVATPPDPSGVGRHGHARAGDRFFLAGEVPEGRHAPLASADLHAGGSGVRRVY